MAVTIVAPNARPEPLVFSGAAPTIYGLEWTAELEELSPSVGGGVASFRQVLVNAILNGANVAQTWWHTFNNSVGTQPDDAYSDLGVFPTFPGVEISMNTYPEIVSRWGAAASHVDGMELFADPKKPPYWGRFFQNIDGLGGTGKIVDTRFESLSTPRRLRFRKLKMGRQTNPPGNLSRLYTTGEWNPLVGDYGFWDTWVEFDGVWSRVERRYLREDFAQSLDTALLAEIYSEWQVDEPGGTLATAPVRVRFSELRAWDGARWHELYRWKTANSVFGATIYTGTDWGITFEDRDHLVWACGHAGDSSYERGVNRHFFLRFDANFRSADGDLGALGSVGDVSIAQSGGINAVGPAWRRAGAKPYVVHEKNRGFFVLHGDNSTVDAAVLTYTAKVPGEYRFAGDFAKWNVTTSPGVGAGAFARIRKNDLPTLLYESLIDYEGIVVDPDDPFSASAEAFDVTVHLEEGERVHFELVPVTSFGEGACRIAIAFEED